MFKTDLALNNLQWLICHNTKTKQTKLSQNKWKLYGNCKSYFLPELECRHFADKKYLTITVFQVSMLHIHPTYLCVYIYIYIYIWLPEYFPPFHNFYRNQHFENPHDSDDSIGRQGSAKHLVSRELSVINPSFTGSRFRSAKWRATK